MDAKDIKCPYCDNETNLVKFPCCGWVCMKCGKTFDEQDIEEMKNDS